MAVNNYSHKAKAISKRLLAVMVVFLLPALLFYNGIVRGSNPYFVVRSINNNLQPITNKSTANPFNEPIVSITFDDGWESVYSDAMPVLHEYNIATTQFVLADQFNNPNYMTKNQVRHLYELGHEIGSHSLTHQNLTLMGEEQLKHDVQRSRLILEGVIGHPVNDFASPFGAYNTRTALSIRREYRSHRTTLTKINYASNSSFYEIGGYTVERDMDAEFIRKLVEEAKQNNGWLVLVYHDIDADGSQYGVTPAQLREHLEAITNSDVKVTTLGLVIDALQERYDG